MKTYYIYNPDAEIYSTWNHKLGVFAWDVDAGYHPNYFGYTNYKYAIRRSQQLMAKYDLAAIEVVDREHLFSHLNVTDWATCD